MRRTRFNASASSIACIEINVCKNRWYELIYFTRAQVKSIPIIQCVCAHSRVDFDDDGDVDGNDAGVTSTERITLRMRARNYDVDDDEEQNLFAAHTHTRSHIHTTYGVNLRAIRRLDCRTVEYAGYQ